MAELWFIRHFRTPWNAEGRLQGRRDVALDVPLGTADARSLRQNLLDLQGQAFSAVWSSPLLRTRQTAALHGFAEPELQPDLAELDFGPLEGCLWSEVEALHPGAWQNAPQELPLGESFPAFEGRVARVLDRVAGMAGAPVLAFGHGAWSACMRCLHERHCTTTLAGRGLANGALVRLSFTSSPLGKSPCAPSEPQELHDEHSLRP